ncbi:MAG: N-acetylmuramoyl-L-alanine amidase [Kouleothrix sp.]|nr:N-acetylmuramoyl-L-alanine amidase [Kouleothrix sp.]
MCLADLDILDYTAQVAAIPLQSGYTPLQPREREAYVTFHYSGVVYLDRSRDAELRALLREAAYQIRHDYGEGSFPDGYLYDFAVLSDGTKVRTRRERVQLWHCGNKLGNARSWSVHVLLGPGQNLTDPQRRSLFELFDALRAESNIPRANVVAHCEWPRVDGEPSRAPTYRRLPQQSACPGATLFPHIPAYRSLPDPPTRYRLNAPTPVYEVPNVDPQRVALSGAAVLSAGQIVAIDETYANGMGHLVGGLGFVELQGATKQ